jgi:hypothetical protein
MLKQAALPFDFFMKIHLFLLVFVVGFALVGESYGHKVSAPHEDPSLPEVSLQLQLRNSDGQLVAYIEPTTMYILNIKLVHEFLDTKENKKIIEKEGEMFEVIQYEQTFRFDKTAQYATYVMSYKDDFPLLFRHDGYLTSPGDILYVSWKITRTIQ